MNKRLMIREVVYAYRSGYITRTTAIKRIRSIRRKINWDTLLATLKNQGLL